MKLSHSRITSLMDNPAEFYLKFIQHIEPKAEQTALNIGSAVHWGIENHNRDLSGYFDNSFWKKDKFDKDRAMAESMVSLYLDNEKKILDSILTLDGEKLELLDEFHEIDLSADLKSFDSKEPNKFFGVIDWLLLTNKGFIIIDYKTSSQTPNWENYLDQIYRYCTLVALNFPDAKICKVGIINLRKTAIRQKANENDEQFVLRVVDEYKDVEKYLEYHEYTAETLDHDKITDYMINLAFGADMAKHLIETKHWFINWHNVNGIYGRSPYYDIYARTDGAEQLYRIEDFVWDEDYGKFVYYRDCNKMDLETLFSFDKILNHYEDYKREIESGNENLAGYKFDESLLKTYQETYKKVVDFERQGVKIESVKRKEV